MSNTMSLALPGTMGVASLNEIMSLGDVLARSGFFSDSRGAAQAVAKIIAGAELGVPPVAAMTGIYIVSGKVTLSANLMAAQIKRSQKYNFAVRWQENPIGCIITFFENVPGNAKPTELGESTFTLIDAENAELTTGGNKLNWKKYPKNMCFARALSNGARFYCADIFFGPVYTPEELDIPVDSEGSVIEGTARPIISDVTNEQPQVATKPRATKPKANPETGEIIEPTSVAPAEPAKSAWDTFMDHVVDYLARVGCGVAQQQLTLSALRDKADMEDLKENTDELQALWRDLKRSVHNPDDAKQFTERVKPAVVVRTLDDFMTPEPEPVA